MGNNSAEGYIYMATSGEADESGFVTIRVFTTESEAYLAKAALEAFGIDCSISGDDCGGQRPHLAFTGGLRLIVRAEDARNAADVLKAQPEDA